MRLYSILCSVGTTSLKRITVPFQTQLLVWHQRGYSGNSSTIIFDFGRKIEVPSADGDMRKLCRKGHLKEAMQILDVGDQGILVDSAIYVSLLQKCINMNALVEGKRVHAHILKSGFKPDIFLGNILVNMYSKCGSVLDAWQVFDKMPERDVVTWNTMIAGYAKHGHAEKAVKLFQQMEREGVKPSKFTFVSILKACASLAALEQGKQIHAHITKHGFESDVFVGSILVDMYSKCSNIEHARQVFDRMPKRDVVSWTAMIGGYAQHGHANEAIKLFQQMKWEGVKPDKVIFLSVLKACANLEALEQGKQIHAQIIESAFESDLFLGTTLVDMYAKCGSVEHARQVFDKMHKREVVLWNAMLSGYARHGHTEKAFKLFRQMEEKGVKPNKVTFVTMLRVCASLAALEEGKQIHARIVKSGFLSDASVGNTLVDMYAKCGCTDCAWRVFDKMHTHEVVSWNAMIAGYARHGQAEEAFRLFKHMILEGVKPDDVTFVSLLKACAGIGALELGKWIHAHIIRSGFEADVFVGNALVDMYAKCGSIGHAYQAFERMPKRDMVSWTAMVGGYAQHGHGKQALQLVENMQQEGIKLDDITFLCILSACSHVGLVKEGRDYFHSMIEDHGIIPTKKHYACMIDLLGRAGNLEEAHGIIEKMPYQPHVVVWTALLGACRLNGNVELAKYASECIFKLEPHNAAAFVQLSNIYAAAGQWDDKFKVRDLMDDRGVKKERGISHIQVNGWVHAFIAEDTTHPQIKVH